MTITLPDPSARLLVGAVTCSAVLAHLRVCPSARGHEDRLTRRRARGAVQEQRTAHRLATVRLPPTHSILAVHLISKTHPAVDDPQPPPQLRTTPSSVRRTSHTLAQPSAPAVMR